MERAKRYSLILHVISLQITSKSRPLPMIFFPFSSLPCPPLFLSSLSFPPFSCHHHHHHPLDLQSLSPQRQENRRHLKRASAAHNVVKKAALEFLLSDVTPIAQHLLRAVHLLGCCRLTEPRPLIELKTEKHPHYRWRQRASSLPPPPVNVFAHLTAARCL